MLHEDLQTDIVRKDGLTSASAWGRAIHAGRHMCRRRVELRKQETCLTAALITYDVSRDRRAVDKKVLLRRVIFRSVRNLGHETLYLCICDGGLQ